MILNSVVCHRQCPAFRSDPATTLLLTKCPLPTGTGSLAAAVETASGRQALVVGKPSPYMFQCITEDFSVDPARTLMVGDRLETDILFGHRCGMTTVLTLTGVSSLEEAQAYLAAGQRDLVPHYYVESIADLMEGLED